MLTATPQKNLIFLTSLLLIAYLGLALLTPVYGHPFDTSCWKSWSLGIFEKGLGNAYSLGLDYNPILLYFFYVADHLLGSNTAITEHIVYYTKLFALVFDMLGIYFTARFLVSRNLNLWPVIFILFNFGYFYNTILWGQVDSIHTALTLISFLFLFNKKLVWGVLFFILALNMKLQAIVYAPFIVLAMLPMFTLKNFSKTAIYAIALQFIIILPFVLQGDFMKIIRVNGVHFYVLQVTSANAYNMWWYFFADPFATSDQFTFLGLTYKTWGLSLFFVSAFFSMLPIVIYIIERREMDNTFYKLFFLSLTLVTLIFFYFNTEMHERYIHPAILFSAIYAILAKDYIMYILLSLAYTLNMAKVFPFFNLDYNAFYFNEKLISTLYLCAFAIGMYRMYTSFKLKTDDVKKVVNIKTYQAYLKENILTNQ